MLATRLKKGDMIGIVAPSSPITGNYAELLKKAEIYFQEKGFRILRSKNLLNIDKYGCSVGTPEEKAEDINSMFKNPDVKAIWCFQGGETANDVLDLLDYNLIKKNPKIFLGKSDIDLLLLAVNKMTGLVTFHAPDFKVGNGREMDFEYSRNAFNERLIEGKLGPIKPTAEWTTIRPGKAQGRILGCNICTILKLAGTKYFPDFKHSILFLESYEPAVRETLYKLRQLEHLRVYDKIKGMVIGYIYAFQDKEILKQEPKLDKTGKGINYEDLVSDVTKDYDFPILKINEFGHKCPSIILPIGAQAELDATKQTINLSKKYLL